MERFNCIKQLNSVESLIDSSMLWDRLSLVNRAKFTKHVHVYFLYVKKAIIQLPAADSAACDCRLHSNCILVSNNPAGN